MRNFLHTLALLVLLTGIAYSAPKSHVISFGKWTNIQWFTGPAEDQPVTAKSRAIFVDGKLKEFTLGTQHEITDRLFVVRRVLRINDALPQESAGPARWSWQPGGWLAVDRVTGHITPASLPDFDPFYSAASWYRDHVAYCAITDDGKKLEGLVVQLGRRKTVLKKVIGEAPSVDPDGAACPAPDWDRKPMRVTFAPKGANRLTYSIRARAMETIKDEDDEEAKE
jgi:hypothetical protein